MVDLLGIKKITFKKINANTFKLLSLINIIKIYYKY